jgi:hypothetical protein
MQATPYEMDGVYGGTFVGYGTVGVRLKMSIKSVSSSWLIVTVGNIVNEMS